MVARNDIPVIFENGVFRPAVPVQLPNGSRHRVVVETAPAADRTALPPLDAILERCRALRLVDTSGRLPTRDQLHERD